MPDRYDVIVVGGGPAGSTFSALAAKSGLRVLLLEAAKHPRVHIGESLLPGVIPILDEMGALEEVRTGPFFEKTGSTHLGWGLTQHWDLWFADSELYDRAWFVERAEFDRILFETAVRQGADAHQEASAKRFLWEGDRVVGVEWKPRGDAPVREARAPLTIDATGQAFTLARELGLRSVIDGLQHQASWAHYEGGGRLPEPRRRQALFVAAQGHWSWLFPLTETLTSVGVIRLDDEATPGQDRERAFEETIRGDTQIMSVLGTAARRVTPVRTQRDWSFRVSKVAGPGWMLAGDSSGFIDPVLSTGVFLAMHAASRAARAAVGVVRGTLDETSALAAYAAEHADLFGNLLRIVRFFYQRNLHKEDYFWESKRVLLEKGTELKPQRAFLALTSGLVQNLVLEERRARVTEQRESAVASVSAVDVEERDPDDLGFVCIHLRYRHLDEDVALYVLLEPKDPGSPTLFRTRNFHLNCMAPRFRNDPISVPELAPHLRSLWSFVSSLDERDGESMSSFWRRIRSPLSSYLRDLPERFSLVRVFGE